MEPLAKVRMRIGADAQADIVGMVERFDLDRTGIEMG